MRTISPRKPRKRTVKLRANGKHKVDAASTISAPIGIPLQRILRPQAFFRWLGPQIAAITPQYIEQTTWAAMSGNHLQQWSLFDLMLKTWPELLQCYQELILGVLRKKLIYEPFHEEDEKPTDSAVERMKLVCAAMRSLSPDPAREDEDVEGTIKNILDAWFRGVSVSEIVWQTVDAPSVGTIIAPQCTYPVDPTNYGYNNEGTLGLRSSTQSSASIGVWPYVSTSLQPVASELAPFPDNKFLIAKHKASSGNPIGGALLRPLAWWWCAANFSSDWLLNLAQVFGLPFRWASYDPNCSPETLASLDQMLQNMGSAGWARFPTPTTLEFVEMGKQGSDHSPQGELLDRADRYARNLILGQTMTGSHGTTGKGGGQAFGEVEADVKSDRIDAAGKFAVGVINAQLVKSILLLNYGDTTEAPEARFLEDEEAGLAEAQRDQVLIKNVGLSVSEAFIRKKYGLPEPEDDDDTLGGPQPNPLDQFTNQFGQQQPDAENPAETKAPNEEQEPAKAGDAPGHAFRGNQHVKIGDYVQTPHGRGMIVAPDGPNASFVSVNGAIRSYKHSDLKRIPYDHSRFPSITQSAEHQRRMELNAQLHSALVKISAIKDDAVFAMELSALAAAEVGDKPGHPFRGNQYSVSSSDIAIAHHAAKMMGHKITDDQAKLAVQRVKKSLMEEHGKIDPNDFWEEMKTYFNN